MSISNQRKVFNEKYGGMSDRQISIELLYSQQLILRKNELIRENLSKLVWWFVAIPSVIAVIYFLIGFNDGFN